MDSKERCNGGNRSLTSTELRRKRYKLKQGWINRQFKRLGFVKTPKMLQPYMNISNLDALIEWKIHRWAKARQEVKEGKMQDQITIECQMDFTDKDKMQEVIKLACSMARTLAANIQLLDPVCKPQCVVYTDNFMSPPEKINIYQDLIGKGNEELQETAGISSELLSAVTGENQ